MLRFLGLCILSCLMIFDAAAQSPKAVNDSLIGRYKQSISEDTIAMHHQLKQKDNLTPMDIQFQLDTFAIEELVRKRLARDYSTAGILHAVFDAEHAYDHLLNRYYQKLKGKLTTKDQIVLLKAQRSWLAYRDNERQLNTTLSYDQYSGGGTIQRVYVADRVEAITKNRLIDIYRYLKRLDF